jgi:hypothetical protein
MRGFLILIVLVGAIAGGGYGVREYAPQYLPDQWTTDAVLRERMRARVAEDDENVAAFFEKFETLFPADYNELMGRSVELYRRGGSREEASALGGRYMRSFIADNQRHVSAAQPEALLELGRAIEAGTSQMRRENLAQCVQFLTDNAGASMDYSTLTPDTRQAFVRITNAMLDSIASGMRTPAQYAEPTQAQWEAWLARYPALGGDRAMLDALGSDARLRTLPPDQVCAAAELMWTAVLSAEDDFGARFVSFSMRQAL